MTSRLLVTVGLVALTLAVAASPAIAGTYQVTSCDDAPDGFTNNAWTYSQSQAGFLETGSDCAGPAGDDVGSIYVREQLGLSSGIPGGVSGYRTFTAPTGTTIATLQYVRTLQTYLDQGWVAELKADNATLESCRLNMGSICTLGGGPDVFSGLSSSTLRVGARCDPIAPDTTCGGGATLHSVTAAIRASTVTINDPGVPTLGTLTGPLVTSPGWLRGMQAASFSALDTTGIRKLELLRNSAALATDTRTCDFTRPAPCANPNSPVNASWPVIDTTSVPDGASTVTARATDAAGNAATTTGVEIRIDNTAPAAPAPTADFAWSAASDATWSVPVPPETGVAPIDQVEVEVCAPTCTTSQLAPPPSGPLTVTRTVGEGTSTLRARLRDAAGNVGAWSNTVPVRRDRTAPAASTPSADFAWTSAADGTWSVPVPAQAAAPITQVDVELCAAGCSTETITAPASGPLSVTRSVGEGTTTLRARLRDAAGNISVYSAAVEVRRDRTGPVALPSSSSEAWRSSTTLPVTWSTPAQDAGSPYATAEFELCPTPSSCIIRSGFTASAGAADLTIPGDGDGTIRSRLIDQVGNAGAWSTSRPVRLDRGLPPAPVLGVPVNNGDNSYTVAVNATDPGPAPLTELVVDVCPGASSSCIAQPKPAGLTQVRTLALSPGTWQIRVAAIDAAGNIGQRASATVAVTATPSPTPTPSPSATATATPSATATGTSSPTAPPSATPTATPSATATPTVAPIKSRPRLAIAKVRVLAKRVRVVGRVAAAATGFVRVTVSVDGRRVAKRVRIGSGAFRAVIRRPLPELRTVRLTVSYSGDSRFKADSIGRTLIAPRKP